MRRLIAGGDCSRDAVVLTSKKPVYQLQVVTERPVLTSPYPKMVKGNSARHYAETPNPTVWLPAQGPRATYLSHRAHSPAGVHGVCDQHECRNEDNQPLWLKTRLLSRILRLYWLGFGVFKLAALLQFASGQLRQNPIGSTLIIIDSV